MIRNKLTTALTNTLSSQYEAVAAAKHLGWNLSNQETTDSFNIPSFTAISATMTDWVFSSCTSDGIEASSTKIRHTATLTGGGFAGSSIEIFGVITYGRSGGGKGKEKDEEA